MREIALTDGEKVRLYDTSGVYTDPTVEIDVNRGLPTLRDAWLDARDDTERYQGREVRPSDDGVQGIAPLFNPELQRQPRRARSGANVTQMHYARRGIITPEMEYIALRENQGREAMAAAQTGSPAEVERNRRLRGNPMGARIPDEITPEFEIGRASCREREHSRNVAE